jgi:dTDP-4-dehydrorhamnose 3,5-epimerase
MRFAPTPLGGAFMIELESVADERGWFARTFCTQEFAAHGIEMQVVQANASFNARAGTLRGMHFQAEPHAERKVIRCTRGAIYDVIVDIRDGSPTRAHWFGVELTAENGRMLFAPEGVAHGFQTLADASEVAYLMSREYAPDHAHGVRWDDPAFGIEWPPADARVISERDRSYPSFVP